MSSDGRESPRRLRAADVIETLEGALSSALTRTTTEPSATVEIDTTAKGEPKPRVHLFAPIDTDLNALADHVNALAQIALTAYFNATPANGQIVADEEVPF